MSINTDATFPRGPHGNSVAAATWIRRISIALSVLGLIALTRALPTAAALEAVIGWVESLGAFAPVAFVVAYFLATVLMLPAWPLSVAAGALFGFVFGTIVVICGATLGMAGSFLIGRYLARPAIERRFRHYPRFAAIDRAVGQGGWKIVALLRLSPAVPFNVQNYIYGLTAIRFWPCMIASAFAIVPGTFMYVYFGYAGRAGINATGAEAGRGAGQWALLVVGLIASIAVTVYVTKLARKAIREQELVDSTQGASVSETSDSRPHVSRNPWRQAGIAAVVAVLILTTLGGVRFAPGILVRLFGPPTVSMNEAYAEAKDGPRFDHSTFDGLLKKHVNSAGGVDYAGLRADQDALKSYLAALDRAPFNELGRDEKFALLINAYNAFTLQLIIEYLDSGIESIRDIPSDNRWDDKRWKIGGNTWSLNEIEHEQIRPKFREPNIHWALVCAAVGCPPLRAEAYDAAHINDQLQDQARKVHTNGSRWFQFDSAKRKVLLTALYNWYGTDFDQVSGGVLEHAAKFSPELASSVQTGERPKIDWLDYDWKLNSQENLK
ncbi:MAG: VTT domain-containing protein [Candidatus Hydrogenedentes bacterium]|nr:VTT domain-containing protein [Candidatus Hydrogenedentota bacterium]